MKRSIPLLIIAIICMSFYDGCEKVKRLKKELEGKSIATIPPSDVWPPRFIAGNDPFKNANRRQKHYALNIPSSTLKMVDGFPVRLVELRGWLTSIDTEANGSNEGEWKDFHYNMELDPEWLDAHSIDLNQIFKVGNLLIDQALPVCVGSLSIHIELNGWDLDMQDPSGFTDGRPKNQIFHDRHPDGWQKFTVETKAPDVFWPYNPIHPLSWQPALEVGQYVRMFGSIVTDEPHPNNGPASEDNIKNLWTANVLDPWDPNSLARWTEMHSPDIISVLAAPDAKPKRENVVTVAICAGDVFKPIETLNINIKPFGPKPSPTAHVEVRELVGPESKLGSIVSGRRTSPGSLTFSGATITDLGDSVNVSIGVTYRLLTGTGLFKAIYRVKWVN